MDFNKLQEIFENYKIKFDNRWADEKYKWENLKQFQDNWNIDAENFVEMLNKSIPDTNLLKAPVFFPRVMILAFANFDSEKVRGMFRDLYNEQFDLKERINKFNKEAEEIRKKYCPDKKNHFQNENVISIYLWLKYPEKYYIYKSRTYTGLKNELNYHPKNNIDTIKPIECFEFYNEIRDYIKTDKEFLDKYKSLLTPDCYYDKALNTLVNDIAFYLYQENGINKKSKEFLIEALNNAQLPFTEDKRFFNVKIANNDIRMLVRTYNGNVNNIAKSQLPELNANIYVAIVWCKNDNPQTIYLVPTTEWNNRNSNIFVERNYEGKKSNPEWGINLSDNKEEQLSKYEFSKIISELNKNAGNMSNDNKRYWVISAGEKAKEWETFKNQSIIAIGWDNYQLGDLTQYKSKQEIVEKLKSINEEYSRQTNNIHAIWQFANEMKPNDIVYVKTTRTEIIARGIVTSEYYYDENKETYNDIRNVKWTNFGEWQSPYTQPVKTLTDMTEFKEDVKKLEEIILNDKEQEHKDNEDDIQYWWLNANPKIFKFSDIEIEEEQYYTLLNENGNKRRIYTNFMAAKKGDLIIGYESTPVKQIVALGEITNRDNEKLYFKKTENLINAIPYSDILDVSELKDMEYLRSAQGSLFKLTKEEYDVLLDIIREVNPQSKQKEKIPYSKKEFLNSVYISEEKYDCIKSVLEHKKNIILQGAPGVGKTYCARKLAYSIMKEVNDDRIEFIQFHQNYSYEDFVMGYKPTQEGFSLEKGVFYKFCKKAANELGKKFFFIIDEINRGNLSKIFGELLMLIENDYRGHKIPLAYDSTDCFAVPENLYIIGLMNTADRSLSLIDYALRRRFSFIDISPAFDNGTFQKYQNELKNEKFNKLINVIVDLNKTISDVSKSGLGKGFCIGHSYFCNFETDKLNDIMLKEIVDCDIIPMINEYWFDEEQLANEWINKLTEAIK